MVRLQRQFTQPDESLLEFVDVAIASVAPLNEVRCIFGPPHEHSSGQRLVVGKPQNGIRNLIDGQEFGGNATLDTLSGCERFPILLGAFCRDPPRCKAIDSNVVLFR